MTSSTTHNIDNRINDDASFIFSWNANIGYAVGLHAFVLLILLAFWILGSDSWAGIMFVWVLCITIFAVYCNRKVWNCIQNKKPWLFFDHEGIKTPQYPFAIPWTDVENLGIEDEDAGFLPIASGIFLALGIYMPASRRMKPGFIVHLCPHSALVDPASLSTPYPCQLIVSLDPIKASSKQVYKAALQAFAHYSNAEAAHNVSSRLHELRFE